MRHSGEMAYATGNSARESMLMTALGIGAAGTSASGAEASPFVQTNLVSDIPGLADVTDDSLKNGRGFHSADEPFWVSDQGTNLAARCTASRGRASRRSRSPSPSRPLPQGRRARPGRSTTPRRVPGQRHTGELHLRQPERHDLRVEQQAGTAAQIPATTPARYTRGSPSATPRRAFSPPTARRTASTCSTARSRR